jgi:hypothetical protein
MQVPPLIQIKLEPMLLPPHLAHLLHNQALIHLHPRRSSKQSTSPALHMHPKPQETQILLQAHPHPTLMLTHLLQPQTNQPSHNLSKQPRCKIPPFNKLLPPLLRPHLPPPIMPPHNPLQLRQLKLTHYLLQPLISY